MTLLTPPFALGAAGQILSGKTLRHSLAAAWQPSTGVQSISGVLHGPANTMGELTLAGSTVTVQPFRAVVQSLLDAAAGSYLCTNDAAVALALPAQDASQFRRALIVVRVDDSQVSGVASSGTTDRGVLEVLSGALAASSGATVLPTPPGSYLALGEALVPPTGQTITLTPYNPRVGLRGAILPVFADTSTVTGHGSAPGAFVGQYRDHPTSGLQRWNGSAWTIPGGDTGYLNFGATPPLVVGGAGCQYRIRDNVVYFRVHQVYAAGGGISNGWMIAGSMPIPVSDHWFDLMCFNPDQRIEARIIGSSQGGAFAGQFLCSRAFTVTANGGYVCSGSYPLG